MNTSTPSMFGFKDESSALGRRRRSRLRTRRNISQQHLRIEAATIGRWILSAGCSAANFCVHVFAELIGADDSIAILVRRAFQSLHDVISEDAMAAAPLRAFKRLLAVAAGRQRKERPVESCEARIDRRRIGGGMIDPLWHESVSSTFHLPLIFLAIESPSLSIGYPVRRDIFRIDIVGREIGLAVVHKTMAGEVDQHPIIVFGDTRQPLFDLMFRRFASLALLPIRR